MNIEIWFGVLIFVIIAGFLATSLALYFNPVDCCCSRRFETEPVPANHRLVTISDQALGYDDSSENNDQQSAAKVWFGGRNPVRTDPFGFLVDPSRERRVVWEQDGSLVLVPRTQDNTRLEVQLVSVLQFGPQLVVQTETGRGHRWHRSQGFLASLGRSCFGVSTTPVLRQFSVEQ
jgi:hypothetical protein